MSKAFETTTPLKFSKFYLDVHRFLALPTLQMKWTPLFHRHCVYAVRYWKGLLTEDDNRLTKLVFLWDMNKDNTSRWTLYMNL